MSYVTDLIARAREIMEFSEDAQLIGELARELEKAQPRIITTAEELDALPRGSIVVGDYATYQLVFGGWATLGGPSNATPNLPAIVLNVPEVSK